MKKTLQLACWIILSISSIYTQNTIVAINPFAPGLNGTNSREYWSRRGNTDVQGTNNIFGTLYNSSIYHYTNNTFKMKLNGNYSYGVNGFNAPRNGFLLIGEEQPVSPGVTANYLQNKGAFSRLHLHDNFTTGGSYDVESGYRPWMRNGIYFSGFSDAGYLGQKANSYDNTDMIFTWSDNSGNDNMTFAFTRFNGLAPNNTTQTSGDLSGEGINGREVMRFAASGNVGMGPRFNAANPPANDLHIRSENATSSFIQIDNQEFNFSAPTPTSSFNGGLFGMLGNISPILNGNILLYNQENRHLLLGTNQTINPVSTTPSTANEKVRITSVGAPTDLVGGSYGINNPYGRPTTNTYVAISANPLNSIKRPYSLLHMGSDIADFSGYRPWMYNGTLISAGTDQMFIGLKQEASGTGNRHDAVISWADDNTAGGTGVGADNLRFIYTQTTIAGSTGPGTALNGAEVARMTPDCPTCPIDKPSMGIGDYSPLSPNAIGTGNYVGATLDLDGDLRIRTVPSDPTLNQVLVIDPLDKNRVHYKDITNLYNSNTGIFNNNNTFQWGVSCFDPNFATNVAANGIGSDRSIQLTADFHFFDPSSGAGRIGIGSTAATNCTTLPNRLVIEGLGANQSGVRLVDLTNASPTVPNTGQVLSVNGSGDIILVDGGAANNGLYSNNGVFQLGVDCNNPNFNVVYPGQGFNDDRTIGLNGNNLVFDGNGGGQVGIGMGPCDPVNNRVEIKSFGAGQSGLRFTNLNIFSPSFTPAPGLERYLTVDINGDVVLADLPPATGTATADNGCSVQPTGNVQFGNDLGNNTADLLNDREVNMDNNNIYFKGQAANNNGVLNAVGIGYNTVVAGTPLRSKLSVLESVGGIIYIPLPPFIYTNNYFVGLGANKMRGTEAISGINQDINNTGAASVLKTGVYGESSGDNSLAQGMNAGGHFYATNGGTVSAGVLGVATSNNNSIGGLFIAENTINSGGTSVGVWGRAYTNQVKSVGVQGEVRNTSTTAENYGVYGTVTAASAGVFNVGVYGVANMTPNNWAAYFDGNVNIGSGGGLSFTSDSIVKTNVNSISNASQILNQLNAVTFNFTNVNVPQINVDNTTNNYGLIAQQVENVLPELVTSANVPATYDSLGNVIHPLVAIKSVDYVEIVPILIAGFNEQNAEIASQDSIINSQDSVINNLQSQLNSFQNQLNDMMAMINNCCSQGNSINTPNINNNQNQFNVTNIDVKLTDNDCVLNVNSPNPFRDNTTVTYTIPETANFAQIIFYNSLGQAIKIVDIDDKGAGRLNVYGEDLRSGMYSYSLIIDGNVCETHKMIKQ